MFIFVGVVVVDVISFQICATFTKAKKKKLNVILNYYLYLPLSWPKLKIEH